MGWFLPLIGLGLGTAGLWGWATAEHERTEQVRLGGDPVDPFGSIAGIFGGGESGGLGGMMLPILLIALMGFGGSKSRSNGSDDDVNITIIEDDD